MPSAPLDIGQKFQSEYGRFLAIQSDRLRIPSTGANKDGIISFLEIFEGDVLTDINFELEFNPDIFKQFYRASYDIFRQSVRWNHIPQESSGFFHPVEYGNTMP
jgi:hypothetical protein